VKLHAKPGTADKIEEINEEWVQKVGRNSGSGWVSTQVYHSRVNPNEFYILATFEDEQKARKSEQGQEHGRLMEQLAHLLETAPEYVDLEPVSNRAP